MAYARAVMRGKRREWALLQHHPSEPCFGVQLAGRSADRLIRATKTAADSGAQFVDLNCGCPIQDATNRGFGARLLQRPAKLGRLVAMFVAGSPLPVTVKIRLGWDDTDHASELARVIEEAGASALSIHGRTRNQRYSRTADYAQIRAIAAERGIPVIGNGDVLTWYEAEARRPGLAGIMVARGALIKPWIFRELTERRELCLSATERLVIYTRLAEFYRDHFGDDERGLQRTLAFLPWHFKFFHRYRHFPASTHAAAAETHPLLQTRDPDLTPDDPLEALLQNADEAVHLALARLLWDASLDGLDAVLPRIRALAEDPPISDGRVEEPAPAG